MVKYTTQQNELLENKVVFQKSTNRFKYDLQQRWRNDRSRLCQKLRLELNTWNTSQDCKVLRPYRHQFPFSVSSCFCFSFRSLLERSTSLRDRRCSWWRTWLCTGACRCRVAGSRDRGPWSRQDSSTRRRCCSQARADYGPWAHFDWKQYF